jgi:multiple antibiotic resistance protein
MDEITYYIKIFIAIFVLVNPLEGIPLFLNKTSTYTKEQRGAVVKKTSIAVFIILIFSLFLGGMMLQLFGINIPAFTLAGGIIIFLIAMEMVLGKSDTASKVVPGNDSPPDSSIAIVPLAIPLLAGPGPISSVILYGSKSSGIMDYVIISAIIVCVAIAVWISLNAATKVQRRLGASGVNVLTKISGLLVAAIAIELIIDGLIKLIPSLAGTTQ